MPKQILVVEDSVTMTKVVEITFAHEDYKVSTARDADEALSRLREQHTDLILADAGLPGKSGYELCTLLKGDPATRDVPVLLLTGNFNPYDEARGQKAGVDGHVVKPFETQVLLDKVADLLRTRPSSTSGAGMGMSTGAPTLVSMPPMQVSQAPAVGAMASMGDLRRTQPPQPPAEPRLMPQPIGIPGAPRPPQPAVVAETGPQRSTLMGIPAVNPLGTGGMRPPPPPGMMMRQTGNMPAINPAGPAGPPAGAAGQAGTAGAGAAGAGGGHPAPLVASPAVAPVAGLAPSGSLPPTMPSWGRGGPTGSAATQGMARGIPAQPGQVPQMPRPSLIPRAPIPATVLAVLERIAQRGVEYEAIAKLSIEVIEQIVWEVVPELAEAMIRAEMDRLIKDRDRS